MIDGSEIYLNELLKELRAITERIPHNVRLPGSPKLTEEMAYLLDKYFERERYLDELEHIIYTSVNLSAIMLNGHSEATYRRISEKYEPSPPEG